MRDFGIELFDRWTALWDGDLSIADEIIADKAVFRYAQPGSQGMDDVHDAPTLAAAIAAFRAARPGLRYRTQGEAVVSMDASRTGLVARPYGARRPAPDGGELDISGTDILRTENGRIVEVWSASGGAEGRSYYPAA